MSGDPQAAVERRAAARHLVQQPLTCLEDDPDVFRLIRRHEADLDRWFTQRLGYRLHVDADSARLFKTTAMVDHRPLRTAGGRALHQLEHVLLALVLATTAAGPAVISLRDLVDNLRSAAAEAEITLAGDATERRALVAVLRWMIDHGLAAELHAHVDAYATDDTADAVLKVRPDRIALLPLPTLVGAPDAATLLDRADRRTATRQWLRSRLVEEPVVDPSGALAGRRVPTPGTVGHAAVLLLDALGRTADGDGSGPGEGTEAAEAGGGFRPVTMAAVTGHIAGLAERNARRWSNDLVASPGKLARQVVDLLVELRLAERIPPVDASSGELVRILPAAARFRPVEPAACEPDAPQAALW